MHITIVTGEYTIIIKKYSVSFHTYMYLVKLCFLLILNHLTFQFVIQVLQNDPDDLDHRQDQRAKCQRACVVPVQKDETEANCEHQTLFSHHTGTDPLTDLPLSYM